MTFNTKQLLNNYSNHISITRQIYLIKKIISEELEVLGSTVHMQPIINHTFYGTLITQTEAIKGLRGNLESSCCEHHRQTLQVCPTDMLPSHPLFILISCRYHKYANSNFMLGVYTVDTAFNGIFFPISGCLLFKNPKMYTHKYKALFVL